MSSMIGLSVIGLFLSVGLAFSFSLQLISLLAVGLQEPPLLPVGTPMAWRVHTLRVLTFLLLLFLLLLMLSDIASFFFGVQKLSEISSVGSNLGDSGLLWHSTVPSLSQVSCCVNLRLLVQQVSVRTMRLLFQALLPYLLVFFSSTLSDNRVGSLRRPLALRQSSDSYFFYKDFITGHSTPST